MTALHRGISRYNHTRPSRSSDRGRQHDRPSSRPVCPHRRRPRRPDVSRLPTRPPSSRLRPRLGGQVLAQEIAVPNATALHRGGTACLGCCPWTASRSPTRPPFIEARSPPDTARRSTAIAVANGTALHRGGHNILGFDLLALASRSPNATALIKASALTPAPTLVSYRGRPSSRRLVPVRERHDLVLIAVANATALHRGV